MNRRRPRQVLECASLLALWQWRRANRKRQRTGAVQDATARSAGSWTQCTRKNERGLSMNRRIGACFGKAALKTHALQTLRDRRASPNRAKRLECVRFIGAFRPARDDLRFMAAMHDVGIVEASHESTHPLPLPGGELTRRGRTPGPLTLHLYPREDCWHKHHTRFMRPSLEFFPAAGLLLLTACVSHPPPSTRQAPADLPGQRADGSVLLPN